MKILTVAFIGSAILMSGLTSGPVAAKNYVHAELPAAADQYYNLHQDPSQAIAPPWSDRGESARTAFGETTFHPEGPANVAD
jgi:hypothetical protein